MRTGANYSTWWNGGLRTVTYFHNMIGILTEIIGSPTPIDIPLVPEKQLPQGDWPLPIAPTTNGQKWHYRQSIEYEMYEQSRHARPCVQVSRDVALQHLSDGAQFDSERQPGYLDHHAQAHRGDGRSRGEDGSRGWTRWPRRTRRRGWRRSPGRVNSRRRRRGHDSERAVQHRFARSENARSARLHHSRPIRRTSPPPQSSSTRCSKTALP